MALMGGGSATDTGLETLSNLAAALTDPTKFASAIAQYKTAKEAAEKAQSEARDVIAGSAAKQAEIAAAQSALDAREAKFTADAEAQALNGSRLTELDADLKRREAALKADRAALQAEIDAAKKSLEQSVKDNATRLANAEAALADRSARLKAGEDALAAARAQYDKDKAALDARVARINAATAAA